MSWNKKSRTGCRSAACRLADARSGWDEAAGWYSGWVGAQGSRHHRALAIPALLALLGPKAGERILDIGCGPGVLAPCIHGTGADYTGIDASRQMVRYARKYHGAEGRFLVADAARLADSLALARASFDAALFLLSIQDMEPLAAVVASAAWALKAGGRIVLLLNHPCFRVPRQSGWGWDEGRGLQYRRVDRYLTSLAVPVQAYHRQGSTTTRSFHRPLGEYINTLADNGLLVDQIKEVASYPVYRSESSAENQANAEIPIFLGVRACKR